MCSVTRYTKTNYLLLITEQGLLLPGIEIDTKDSSPREMTVIDNKLYFTNWNTKDIKIC